jgi:hypothetical protein
MYHRTAYSEQGYTTCHKIKLRLSEADRLRTVNFTILIYENSDYIFMSLTSFIGIPNYGVRSIVTKIVTFRSGNTYIMLEL